MKCLRCFKTIDKDDLYCGYCGTNQKRFEKYLKRVEKKIHLDRDREYNLIVSNAQNKLNELQSLRENELNNIISGRWSYIGTESFAYNLTEGKIKINGEVFVFSDIKGAEVVREDSYRTITTSTGKTKKHVSLGKAVVGGTFFGPIGALAGGAMGNTTTSGRSYSNSIPTCNHVGVIVNIKGFTSEIIILDNNVDQDSHKFKNAIIIAQQIVDKLRVLSETKVPKTYIKPEDEKIIKFYNKEIVEAEKELKDAIDNKPTYEIPESYFE